MADSSGDAPAVLRSNLPLQLTSFIGRERESQAVMRLLSCARLLTLTGPPGCGKTRLALETGRALLERFPDGVWMVDLSQTSDPQDVARLAAQSLALVILGDTGVENAVIEYLRSRQLLLVFDNCEHVVEAAARLCLAILSACPQVQVLATSQLPLGIPGEQEWLVPSLPLPEADDLPQDLEELRAYGAVRLFEERAAAVLPGFSLNAANAAAVVDICHRLDGIPLAIELAAARVKLFAVQEIDRQLDNRFELLAAPRRLVVSRHQTLQSAIDWSFHLLRQQEQLLLCRLAVFTGSFTLEAAAEVCGYEPLDPDSIVNLFFDLVDRSLVSIRQREENTTRYRLLESIRLYGLARLTEEEQTRLKDRHLGYFTRLAEGIVREESASARFEQVNQLEADWPNIRAAAGWVLATPDLSRLYSGLRMTANLTQFLRDHDHYHEPVVWLEGMLALVKTEDSPDWLAARADAYQALGHLSYLQHPAYQSVRDQFETSRDLWRRLGPGGRSGYARAMCWLGYLEHQDFQKALDDLQECQEIFEAEQNQGGIVDVKNLEATLAFRMHSYPLAEKKFRALVTYAHQSGYPKYEASANLALSLVMQEQGRYTEAVEYAYLGYEIYQTFGSQREIVVGLSCLIEPHIALGNLQQAQEFIEQASAIQDRLNLEFNRADILYDQGEILLLKGDFEQAAACFYKVSREHFLQNYRPGFYASCLVLAASVAENDPVRAARLVGFAKKTAGTIEESMLHENTQAVFVDRLKLARILLGDAAFDRAVAEGAGCSLDDLIPPEETAVLSAAAPPVISPGKIEKARFSGLTRREREVAARIAQGLTNVAIAEELVISERTVTTHVTSILSRLGFSSRTQIAAWAAEKGLLEDSPR